MCPCHQNSNLYPCVHIPLAFTPTCRSTSFARQYTLIKSRNQCVTPQISTTRPKPLSPQRSTCHIHTPNVSYHKSQNYHRYQTSRDVATPLSLNDKSSLTITPQMSHTPKCVLIRIFLHSQQVSSRLDTFTHSRGKPHSPFCRQSTGLDPGI